MYEITEKLYRQLKSVFGEYFDTAGEELLQEGLKELHNDQIKSLSTTNSPDVHATSQDAAGYLFTEEILQKSEKIKRSFKKYESMLVSIGKEPLNMYSLMAKMFAYISRAASIKFGKEGEEAAMEAVRRFGEERGRDIARRAAAVGEPNGIDNYLTNYDMGRSELFTFDTDFHSGEIEQTFTKCAFADQWKKDGMEEYGILYCHMIDPAVAAGYNPKFEVVHDKYILKENEGVCHFRFQMKESHEGSDGK
jgi:hypothetical protein